MIASFVYYYAAHKQVLSTNVEECTKKPQRVVVEMAVCRYCRASSSPIPTCFFACAILLHCVPWLDCWETVIGKKRCTDGGTYIVIVCPALSAHCHPYDQFLWFLALLSLQPSKFLENSYSTCCICIRAEMTSKQQVLQTFSKNVEADIL